MQHHLNSSEIHIDEENTNLIWGLVAVVTIAAATYMLTNAFMAGSWTHASYVQVISAILFSVGIYGVIRISTPLYHFVLRAEETNLKIEIWQDGETPIDVQAIPLPEIQELHIAPRTPRTSDDALFDFSTSYYLLYRLKSANSFNRLIDLEGKSFALKVEDIQRIMQFLHRHQPTITIPAEDAVFL